MVSVISGYNTDIAEKVFSLRSVADLEDFAATLSLNNPFAAAMRARNFGLQNLHTEYFQIHEAALRTPTSIAQLQDMPGPTGVCAAPTVLDHAPPAP